MRVLLVEDDSMMADATKIGLVQAGYRVDWVENAEDADLALSTTAYDAVVLDVNLPGMSGVEALTQWRKASNGVPVLLLTARGLMAQKIEGFSAGADDYLVKPFELDELLARLHALIRRSYGRTQNTITHGDLVLYPEGKTLQRNGVTVPLSAREFAILSILFTHRGKILSKIDIEEKLYGWDMEVESNTVEVHVSHLRKKIGSDVIRTIRGLGYVV